MRDNCCHSPLGRAAPKHNSDQFLNVSQFFSAVDEVSELELNDLI